MDERVLLINDDMFNGFDNVKVTTQPIIKATKNAYYIDSYGNPNIGCMGPDGARGCDGAKIKHRQLYTMERKALLGYIFTIRQKYHGRFDSERIISIDGVSDIPLETLLMYTFNIHEYKKNTIIIGDKLRITVKKTKIGIYYENLEYKFQVADRQQKTLIKECLKLYDNYFFIKGSTVQSKIAISNVLAKYFCKRIISNYEIYKRVTFAWKLEKDGAKKAYSLNNGCMDKCVFFNSKYGLRSLEQSSYKNITYPIIMKLDNFINNRQEWLSVFSKTDPFIISGSNYTCRFVSAYSTGLIVTININLIPNDILEADSVFNENRDLNFDNLSLYGINHIYRHVETVFEIDLYTAEEDRLELAKKLGVNLEGDLKKNILDKLNSIN